MRREEEQENVNAWSPTLAFADDGQVWELGFAREA